MRYEEQASVLSALREDGIQILIDDFGIGSSLESLKFFPLDFLKINQAFVKGAATATKDRAIISAMIDMAHALGLRVIAQGVETSEQLTLLQAEGCDEIQGYLISRPVTATNIRQMLQAKSEFSFVMNEQDNKLLPTARAPVSSHSGFA